MKNKILSIIEKTTDEHKGKILIIDDDVALTSILENRYKIKDYYVATVSNADEGLFLLKIDQFDLVIIDIYLDTMYADEFIKKVRGINNLNSNAKIIVLADFKDNEEANRLLYIGADAALEKPFNPKELDDMLKQYIK